MEKVRMLVAASALAATSMLVAPAAPAGAGSCFEGGPRCTVWQSPICREEVPKAIRVAAGCFDIRP